MSKIQDAVAKAKEKAAETVETTALVPAGQGGNLPVAANTNVGQMKTLSDFQAGSSMSVDGYISVGEFGITCGDSKPRDTLKVIIDLEECLVNTVVRFGDNPVTYLKTRDGVNCVQGGSWNEALATARNVNPRVRPYDSVDIPMVLLEPLNAGDKTFEIGSRVGHSTSYTTGVQFNTFLRTVQKAGLTGPLEVLVGFLKKTKPGVKPWGVLTFELVGSAEEPEAEAA